MRSFIILFFLFFTASAYGQSGGSVVFLTNGISNRVNNIELVKNQKESNPYLLLDGKQKIPLNLVSAYQIDGAFYLVKEMGDLGYVAMLRTVDGAISIYNFSHEQYDPFVFTNGRQTNKYTFYLYNNELKQLVKENLKKDLVDYPDYVKRINRIAGLNAAKALSLISGFGLTGVGIANMFEYDPAETSTRFVFRPNGALGAGLGLIYLSTWVGKRSKDNLHQVVLDFNEEHG